MCSLPCVLESAVQASRSVVGLSPCDSQRLHPQRGTQPEHVWRRKGPSPGKGQKARVQYSSVHECIGGDSGSCAGICWCNQENSVCRASVDWYAPFHAVPGSSLHLCRICATVRRLRVHYWFDRCVYTFSECTLLYWIVEYRVWNSAQYYQERV